MKKYLILLSIVGLLFFSQKNYSQNKDMNVCLGEKHHIISSVNGKTYELIIQIPSSYFSDTLQKFPVVYFCDGYYDFPLFTSIYGNLMYDQRISECFLVGFSYVGENIDYGPLRFHDYLPTYSETNKFGGGAAEYLKIVENDFIKYMESNFRIDETWRALGGSSAGGMFCLYSLFSKPELFNAYMAISPAAEWDNRWLFQYEKKFREKNKDLAVSLFMTGAEKEFSHNPGYINSIKAFNEVLLSRNYNSFRYQFRLLDDAYHADSKPEGYTRGMQFIFAPLID